MLEKIKENPAIAAAIIFASGFTFAFIAADQLVYRRAQLIADLEKRELQAKVAVLDAQRLAAERRATGNGQAKEELVRAQHDLNLTRQELERAKQLLQAKPDEVEKQPAAHTEKELGDCRTALESQRSETLAAKTKLSNYVQNQRDQSYQTSSRIQSLERQVNEFERANSYRGTIDSQSVYPRLMREVTIGSHIVAAQRALAAYSPRLTDTALMASLPSGPFSDVTYYHDQATNDPEIYLILFRFRDDAAREIVRADVTSAFGSRGLLNKVEGRVLQWTDESGITLTLNEGGYWLRGRR